MCGRYHLKRADREAFQLALTLGLVPPPSFAVRYNIAPSQTLPVVATAENGLPRMAEMRWGLVPYWEKSEKPKMAPINARAEEAFTKSMFKQSVQNRRVLIPAEGFYEWQKLPDKRKQPYEFHLKGDRPFFFAGVHEEATASRPETFLFFTTRPNELMSPIHQRMPAILTNERARDWLTPGPLTADEFASFMEPHDAADMEAMPVSSLVNSPRNDVPECLERAILGQIELEPAPLPKAEQQELF